MEMPHSPWSNNGNNSFAIFTCGGVLLPNQSGLTAPPLTSVVDSPHGEGEEGIPFH
jgi:hypothetical protein